jgi:hypothetical protein
MTESEDSAWRMNALVQVQVRVRQSNRLTLSSLGSTIPLAPELRELTSPDQLMQLLQERHDGDERLLVRVDVMEDGLQGRSVTSPAREARCGMIIH